MLAIGQPYSSANGLNGGPGSTLALTFDGFAESTLRNESTAFSFLPVFSSWS
jgi:hypothetical protein